MSMESLIGPLDPHYTGKSIISATEVELDSDSDTCTRVSDCSTPTTEQSEWRSQHDPAQRLHDPWKSGCILQVYDEVWSNLASKVALTSSLGIIDYQTLRTRANKLGRYLTSIGVQNGTIVAIQLPRCIDGIVCEIAIWKARAIYMPIDCSLHEARLKAIVNDSQVSVLLTYRSNLAPKSYLQSVFQTVICLDSADVVQQVDKLSPENLCSFPGPKDTACILYTSGSTGTPKGVSISHEGVTNMLEHIKLTDEICKTDRVMAFAPYCFDASFREINGALAIGAGIYIPSEDEILPGNLVAVLHQHRISCIYLTPSVLRACEYADLPFLRFLALIGEKADTALMQKWNKNCIVFNGYGPTEATVCSTSRKYDPGEIQSSSLPVSIGLPILNTYVYILDSLKQPVSEGAIGEIYVGGVGVSPGYINRPNLNAQVFFTDPWQPGGRMFKTGDLGRRLPNGELQCLGRIDHQIKLYGHRVDVDDIERLLRVDDRVKDAIVDLRGPSERQFLAAYIIRSKQALHWNEVELIEDLKSCLIKEISASTVPSTFTFVDSWPKSLSNKVVKARLPDPIAAMAQTPIITDKDHVQDFFSFNELRVVEVFRKVFGLPKNAFLKPVTTYSDVGGTSIVAQKFLNILNDEFGSQIRLRTFYASDLSIRSIAALTSTKQFHGHDDHFGRDFSKEILLPHDVRPFKVVSSAGCSKGPGCILLTGATGFLGAHLVSTLLDNSLDTVLCLIRAEDNGSALERLKTTLRRWKVWKPSYNNRLEAVAGDVSQPYLGMNPVKDYERLARQCREVWHSAAAVNFLAPYEHLKPINVDGTIEVLRFASILTSKRVIHMSTVTVFSSLPDDIEPVSEISCRRWSSGLRTGYSQSKWVSEQLALEYAQLGGDVIIIRPARILASTLCPENPKEELSWCLLQSFTECQLIPDVDWSFSWLPVDVAARICVQLGKSALSGIFHVCNPKKITIKFLATLLEEELGIKITSVPWSDWKASIPRSRALQTFSSIYLDEVAGPGLSQADLMLKQKFFMEELWSLEQAQKVATDSSLWSTPDYKTLLKSYFRRPNQ